MPFASALLAFCCLLSTSSASDDSGVFLAFIRQQAETLRRGDEAPESAEQWHDRREQLRQQLLDNWGGFPGEPCALAPRELGRLQRDGYHIEKVIFQTRPGVWMTANVYVPQRSGRSPAVLCVHGHWRGAKQDPVVQQRCIGLAKLGFLVLVVDAFGAGERGLTKELGQYHGEMTGATLLPVGLPLAGLQVYENMRAVDYLCSRDDVDPDRIGITGASGGGNQTTYAGAFDERLKAVVPVCSVGNYHAYLGTACCMCELLPGALKFTDQGDVLALTAPRGLMVISATRDAPQFSVAEAQRSVARVTAVARLLGQEDHVRHTIIESAHDYNQPMREAMYGWMHRFLREPEADSVPITEPPMDTEDPEMLRCFPGDSRPDDWITVPQFAAAQARIILEQHSRTSDPGAWPQRKQQLCAKLQRVLGDNPAPVALEAQLSDANKNGRRTLQFVSEPGITLPANWQPAKGPKGRLILLLDLEGAGAATTSSLAAELRQNGWSLLEPELRATGQLAVPNDGIGQAPDHNTAQWSIWIGRPLLGQWVWDVRRALDALEQVDGPLPSEITVVGRGPAGMVALCAAALDQRLTRVVTLDTLASFVSDVPYRGQRVGILTPGILRDVGDVAHIAALVAPRKVIIGGGVSGGGKQLAIDEIRALFAPAVQAFDTLAAENLQFIEVDGVSELLRQ